MNELKKLKRQYKDGKIDKAAYEAALQALLDGQEISQEEFDDSKGFDPKADDEKAIFTQSDVDSMIARESSARLRTALKKAGVAVDVANKDLMAKVIELVKAGEGKSPDANDQELKKLRADAARVPELEAALKKATVENAVVQAVGKYQPHNAQQIIRALNADYSELLQFDEDTGALKPASVARAVKRIAEVEPNLFKNPAGEDEDGKGDDKNNGGNGFHGKPPGGGQGGKPPTGIEATVTEGLALMGIKKQQ